MTPQEILLYTYTFKKGAPEPHKGDPCAELGMAATKQAMDWHNFQRGPSDAISTLSPMERDKYWADRWYVLERTHCLLRRMQEHWKDIPAANRPFTSVSKQKFYRAVTNARYHALDSLRTIRKTYRKEVPPAVKKSSETEEYRKGLKKWLIFIKCATPKKCKDNGQCDCPDLLSEFVVLAQVSFRCYTSILLLILA